MVNKDIRAKYVVTIGIECHVQLKTATKLFDAVGNDAREAEPNTLIGPLSFGLPGALPVLNKEAVHLAMRAAFALNTKPQKFSAFDRKHYFYPDLPLGYQTTQFEHPIIADGSVTIEVDGTTKKVGITRAHLEADAGKSTHPTGGDYSLVDLNRAGTPLLEIVSEPDMHTAAEAKAYARELWLAMRYADVSDCNMYYGNMRFDVNVSVSKDPKKLGTRTETKNLNSFRAVEKAIEYEVERQIERLEKGEQIVQETRGWDDTKQRTFSQRTKEEAHDYRYFPDPDLPPVVLDDSLVQTVKNEMPVLPAEWRKRLEALGLDIAQTDTLLEGELDHATVSYLQLIEAVLQDKPLAKALANWAVNLEIPLYRKEGATPKLDNEQRLHLYRETFVLANAGKLSSSNAKTLLTTVLTSDLPEDMELYARQHNLIQESDEGELDKIVAKVLEENPKAAEDVKNGEAKAIGFLVGQVMKLSQGRANPGLAQQIIKKHLGV
ncbi:MAG TPA: Asp-tRNA(Asn)/Glu-tRNA(Gln) amidotransferase subunit GatB [Candidatus Saccharimonadales bacterium]|nr:Asp-tRNA(Asn)/Glu-tRNA(Gln) amidotransferase subunit GatB [Candidatus Saccharimonadales bacterium]